MFGVHVVEQQLKDLGLPAPATEKDERVAVLIDVVGSSPPCQQLYCHLPRSVLTNVAHWHIPLQISPIGIGPADEKIFDDARIALRARNPEGCIPEAVGLVDLGTTRSKELDMCEAAPFCGLEKRCLFLPILLVDQRWVRVQEYAGQVKVLLSLGVVRLRWDAVSHQLLDRWNCSMLFQEGLHEAMHTLGQCCLQKRLYIHRSPILERSLVQVPDILWCHCLVGVGATLSCTANDARRQSPPTVHAKSLERLNPPAGDLRASFAQGPQRLVETSLFDGNC
mmetsp:Transcript_95815/g.184787  ORF Transcript_95815/g.184787 Transcript_95815/m.184787 type:complete len:280 (-) Transcript_95815:731-1570(-)